MSISELSRRTGVPQATLRTWESRYGAPRPQRLPGGHRRYTADHVTLVEEVLRQRAAGFGVQAAFEQAAGRSDERSPSAFAELRRRHPDLETQDVRKDTLLALTRAIEDECCARADSPVLFAAFQRERFYRQSQQRWRELARTAASVVVFADFRRHSGRPRSPHMIRIPEDAPLRREWVLVGDTPDHPGCVAGWEYPGQDTADDADRRFEIVWTVDGRVVRLAAESCAALAAGFAPRQNLGIDTRLDGAVPAASKDLQRAAGVLTRTLRYVDG